MDELDFTDVDFDALEKEFEQKILGRVFVTQHFKDRLKERYGLWFHPKMFDMIVKQFKKHFEINDFPAGTDAQILAVNVHWSGVPYKIRITYEVANGHKRDIRLLTALDPWTEYLGY